MIPASALTRHVGIFGATGTGKTTSLAALIEAAPCPTLVLDAKGDLEALGETLRAPAMKIDAAFLSRALELSDAQAGTLEMALHDRSIETLGELRAVLDECAPTPSIAVLRRRVFRLPPWLFGRWQDPRDTIGRTVIACSMLPAHLYSAYAAQVLDSLYAGLGELGDVPAGLLVVVDEAHLLFADAPAPIMRRLEQIVRLIRSKGVGLVFVTQSPSDLPSTIVGQLGSRIQHGLRAATVAQQRDARAAAETMPGRWSADDLLNLRTGEAIISVLGQSARRTMIQRGRLLLGSVGVAIPDVASPIGESVAAPPWWRTPLLIIAGVWSLIFILNLIQTPP